jgi:hypothetical protein
LFPTVAISKWKVLAARFKPHTDWRPMARTPEYLALAHIE